MLVLCGAGMKMPGFGIKMAMVKEKRSIDMSGCGNRMRAAIFSPQNLSSCTAE